MLRLDPETELILLTTTRIPGRFYRTESVVGPCSVDDLRSCAVTVTNLTPFFLSSILSRQRITNTSSCADQSRPSGTSRSLLAHKSNYAYLHLKTRRPCPPSRPIRPAVPPNQARHAFQPGPPCPRPANPASHARRPCQPCPPTRPAKPADPPRRPGPTSRDKSSASAVMPSTRPASIFQLPAHQRQLGHFPLLLSTSKNIAVFGDPCKNVAITRVRICGPLHAHRLRW